MELRKRLREKDEGIKIAFDRKFVPIQLVSDALAAFTELGALLWIVSLVIARKQPTGQFVYVQQLVARAISSANGFITELSTIVGQYAFSWDFIVEYLR
jgi:ATP-binding cassette subfamily B protein